MKVLKGSPYIEEYGGEGGDEPVVDEGDDGGEVALPREKLKTRGRD